MKSLKNLLENQVRDLSNIELQILKTLPKIIKASKDKALIKILEQHIVERSNHTYQLSKINKDLNVYKPHKKVKNKAIAVLVKETNTFLEKENNRYTKDTGIIAQMQKIEFYEISCYIIALRYAKELNLDNIAFLLNLILNDKYEIDEKLTDFAEDRIKNKLKII